MANAAVEIKVPADIEYRVIGNALGLMIACGGLLGGMMVSQGSIDYWREDIVPLGLAFLLAFRLMRSFVMTMTAAQALPARSAPPFPVMIFTRSMRALGSFPEP